MAVQASVHQACYLCHTVICCSIVLNMHAIRQHYLVWLAIYITDCRVLTAHNSPNYQPPSPLSGPSLKAACQPPSPPSVSTPTTRRMLCLKSAVPESLLDLSWQVHSLTAPLLLSQEDAVAGTLRPLWAETFLPVYPGSGAPGDQTLAPL